MDEVQSVERDGIASEVLEDLMKGHVVYLNGERYSMMYSEAKMKWDFCTHDTGIVRFCEEISLAQFINLFEKQRVIVEGLL